MQMTFSLGWSGIPKEDGHWKGHSPHCGSTVLATQGPAGTTEQCQRTAQQRAQSMECKGRSSRGHSYSCHCCCLWLASAHESSSSQEQLHPHHKEKFDSDWQPLSKAACFQTLPISAGSNHVLSTWKRKFLLIWHDYWNFMDLHWVFIDLFCSADRETQWFQKLLPCRECLGIKDWERRHCLLAVIFF